MRRREFIGLVGSAAAAWPMLAQAQNTNKAPRRIAFFPDLNPVALEYWQADMRVLGWIEGQDFIVLPSGIEYGSRNPSNEDAQRVVANKPDLIFTVSTNYALAAHRATGNCSARLSSIAPRGRLIWSFTSSRSRTPIKYRQRSPRSRNGTRRAYC